MNESVQGSLDPRTLKRVDAWMGQYAISKQEIGAQIGFYKAHVRNFQLVLGALFGGGAFVAAIPKLQPTPANFTAWYLVTLAIPLVATYLVLDIIGPVYIINLIAERMVVLERRLNEVLGRRVYVAETYASPVLHSSLRPLPGVTNPDAFLWLEAMAADMTDMAARLSGMARALRERTGDVPEENRTPTTEDRAAARQFMAQIRGLQRHKQREKLLEAPAEIRWALCDLLCLESQRVCADDPKQAASLAELALELADLAPGKEAWRAKLRGLAWAHIGNALRARGEDLPAAEAAFTSAEESWAAGGEAHRGLLEEGLVFALKASLRRAQRRFEEAAELLDRASAVAIGTRFRVQVLISSAKLAEELGELDRAVAILCEAGQTPVQDDDGRLTLCVQHNLADNLSKLDRFVEADGLLPAVRELSRKCGGEIDAVRLLWTEGRVAAGLGRIEEGIEALSKVRGGFASRGMGYDTTLVSLELSLLYAGQGRTEQVKNLARHMTPIFKAQDVHREALAALTVFRRAAEQERVNEDFAREVLSYLRKARCNPQLRFKGGVAV